MGFVVIIVYIESFIKYMLIFIDEVRNNLYLDVYFFFKRFNFVFFFNLIINKGCICTIYVVIYCMFCSVFW